MCEGVRCCSLISRLHRLRSSLGCACRLASKAGMISMAAMQQRQRQQPSRLAPLQEACSITPSLTGSNRQQQQLMQQQQGLEALSSSGSLFGGHPTAVSFKRNSSSVSTSTSFRARSPVQGTRGLLAQGSVGARSSMPDRGQKILWQASMCSTGSLSGGVSPCAEGAGETVGSSRSGGKQLQKMCSMQRSAGQGLTPRSGVAGGRAAAEECVM